MCACRECRGGVARNGYAALLSEYIGHNYIGHNYIGHNYYGYAALLSEYIGRSESMALSRLALCVPTCQMCYTTNMLS